MTRSSFTVVGISVLMVLVATLWSEANELQYPANVFPQATFAVLILLGVLIIGTELAGRGSKVYDGVARPSWEFIRDFAVTLFATVVYVVLFPVAGFYITTFFFLYGLFLLSSLDPQVGPITWKSALAVNAMVSFTVTLVVYLCFAKLLKVPAPSGLFF